MSAFDLGVDWTEVFAIAATALLLAYLWFFGYLSLNAQPNSRNLALQDQVLTPDPEPPILALEDWHQGATSTCITRARALKENNFHSGYGSSSQ